MRYYCSMNIEHSRVLLWARCGQIVWPHRKRRALSYSRIVSRPTLLLTSLNRIFKLWSTSPLSYVVLMTWGHCMSNLVVFIRSLQSVSVRYCSLFIKIVIATLICVAFVLFDSSSRSCVYCLWFCFESMQLTFLARWSSPHYSRTMLCCNDIKGFHYSLI